MDQRKREPNRETRKAHRGTLVGRAENDDEEHEGRHRLADECRGQAILARRVLAIAVRCEATGEIETRFATGDEIERPSSDDAAHYLWDDVGNQMATRGAD